MTFRIGICLLLKVAFSLFLPEAYSSVELSGNNLSYEQDFDSLPVPNQNGEILEWNNNVTLQGWFRDLITTSGTIDNSRNWSGTGSAATSSVPALFNWGTVGINDATDRALGFRVSINQSARMALVIKNNSLSELESVTISFRGEQWRRSGQLNQTQLLFSYKITSSDLDSSYKIAEDIGFTRVEALDFTSPIFAAGATGIDGNAVASSRSLSHKVVFPEKVKVGDSIILLWEYPVYNFSGHGLAIDNFSARFHVDIKPMNPKIGFSGNNLDVLELQWEASPGSFYEIEETEDLRRQAWKAVAQISSNSNQETWLENSTLKEKAFYRIKSLPSESFIRVADFGATPDDGLCDTDAINDAIQAAVQNGYNLILFEAGTYELIGTSTVQNTRNDNYFGIFNVRDLTLLGAIDAEGSPTTRLERQLTLSNDIDPYHLFDIRNTKGLTIKNFILSNNPALGSTGRVIAVDTDLDVVEIELLDGLSGFDGMRASSAHVWDLQTQKLKRFGRTPYQATLNFGLDINDFWEVVPNSNERRYKMVGSSWSSKVVVGDGISWHYQPVIRNQTEVFYSEDFTFENIIMPNLSNMAMLGAYSKNLTFRRIRLEPEGGNLAVGARDGFHLSNNSGALFFEDSYFKGLRMDPLVIRRTYGVIKELFSNDSISVKPGYTIPIGDSLRFWVGEDPVDISITSVQRNADGFYTYGLSEDLPAGAGVGTALSFLTYSLDSGLIRGCEFEDSFGSPIVNFEENITVESCVFDNNAYQIKYGPNHVSGGFVRNNIFRNNLIKNTSWVDIVERGQPSCLLIHSISSLFNSPRYNKNISIYGNTFRNLHGNTNEVAIDVRNATDVQIRDNIFEGFTEAVKVHLPSTRRIEFIE